MSKKFLYYVPYFVYKNIDLSRPHTQITTQFKMAGYQSTLLIGKKDINEPVDFKVEETGVFSYKKSDRGLGTMLREILSAFSRIRKISPDVAIFHGNYSPNTILSFLLRGSSFFFRRSRPLLIMKLDWDGDLYNFSTLGRFTYLSFVFLSSLMFDRLTIETPCGYEKISNYPFIGRKLKMVPNTAGATFFPVAPYDNSKREKTIISVSVLNKNKSVDLLITSFYEANKILPGWKLKIIGPETEPGYLKTLLDLVEEYKIQDLVEFLGQRDPSNVREHYLKASIFCLLSKKESFAISRLEAIASGLPVITSKAGCAEHLEGALSIDTTEPKEVSNYLLKLMEDSNLRDNMVERAQKSLINWKDIIEDFVKD